MSDDVEVGVVGVDPELHRFLVEEALPGSGTSEETLWRGLGGLVDVFAPRIQTLLAERARLQEQIGEWHRHHPFDVDRYRDHLERIGYLLPPGPPFTISTRGVDPEISTVAGPQLVVPVTNARYALNAANARWASLYDALYGTDALGSAPPPGAYDPAGVPRSSPGSGPSSTRSYPSGWGRTVRSRRTSSIPDGSWPPRPKGTPGWPTRRRSSGIRVTRPARGPSSCRHNGLHIQLVVDRTHPVGRDDRAGVADVLLESALTSIMDCEDSVVAVDASDKAVAYRNWLGLMKGDLTAEVQKGDAQRLVAWPKIG